MSRESRGGVEGHPLERMTRRTLALRQALTIQVIPGGRLKLSLTDGEPVSSPAPGSLCSRGDGMRLPTAWVNLLLGLLERGYITRDGRPVQLRLL